MAWPIPTSGEAMVSLKGRVGSSRGRYSRRRWQTRKRRRAGSVENATWFPYTVMQDDINPGLQSQLARVTQLVSTPVTISPLQDWRVYNGANNEMTTQMFGTPKLLRMQGAIYVMLPKTAKSTADAQRDRPVLFYWGWRRVQVSASQTVQVGESYNPFQNPDTEGYNVLKQRGPGALTAWGTMILQRSWNGSLGYMTVADAAVGDGFDYANSSAEYDFLSRATVAKVPFPRIPKQGLLLPENQTFRLEVAAMPIETQITGVQVPAVSTSAGAFEESEEPYILPFFRYLVSWDDT